MEKNIVTECHSCLAHEKPHPIQNLCDPFDSYSRIAPYLPSLQGENNLPEISLKTVEHCFTLRDITGLRAFLSDLVVGKKMVTSPLSSANREAFYAFSENMRYRLPQVSITTLKNGEQQFEVLAAPFLPRACPKEFRRLPFLRCTISAPETDETSEAVLERILSHLPSWQRADIADVQFANTPAERNGQLFYAYFASQANVYPWALLEACKLVGCQIGDFQYTDTVSARRSYSIAITQIRHKRTLRTVNESATHFIAMFARMRDCDGLSFSGVEISYCVLARDFKNALIRLAVSAYELAAGQRLNLDSHSAFRYIENVIRSKYSRFGAAGRIVAEIEAIAASSGADVLQRTDQALFLKILQKIGGNLPEKLARDGANAIMNEFLDELRGRPDMELYVIIEGEQNGREVRPLAEGDKEGGAAAPLLGLRYLEVFRGRLEDPLFVLQMEIMRKHQVDPRQVSQNQLLPPARFARVLFRLSRVRYAGCRGECSAPAFSKYADVKWQGSGGDLSILVNFSAEIGQELTDDDVCSSLVRQPVLKSVFESAG